MPDGSPDDLFVEALQQMGAVTFAQIEAARAEQAQQAGQGPPRPLADFLIQRGVITPLMRENVEKKLRVRQAGGIKQLGPYKLLRKLGEGGMGAVYLAEDTQVGRPCAIKVLPKKYSANREFLTRFHREAVATGKLNHPNIVMAYTVGEELGVHFYAMEYCDGEPLNCALERAGRVPWQVAVEIVMQVARGLQHAHEHAIIHRDIKPSNIFICRPPGAPSSGGPEGTFPKGFTAKILDLGLSKTISGNAESSFLTQTGMTLGTPHYISPEQANGEKDIDGRADIYSLGATFYHLITGQTPFSGPTPAAVIMKHMRQQLPNPKDLNPDLPDGISLVIQRMMAKEPGQRYATCNELVDDLEQLMAGQLPTAWGTNGVNSVVAEPLSVTVALEKPPPLAPAPTAPTLMLSEPPPSTRRLRVAAIAAALLLAVITLCWALASRGSSASQGEAKAAALRLQQERERAQAAVEEAERAQREAESRARQAEKKAGEEKRASAVAQGAKLSELEQQLLRERNQAEEAKRQLEEARRQVEETRRQAEERDRLPLPSEQSEREGWRPEPTRTPEEVPPESPRRDQEKQKLRDDAVLAELERWVNSVFDEQRSVETPEWPKVAWVDDVDGLKRLQGLLARRALEAQDAERGALDKESAARSRINTIQRRLNPTERPPTMPDGRPLGRPPSRPIGAPEELRKDREMELQQLSTLNTQCAEARRDAERMGQAYKVLSTARQVVTTRLRALGAQDVVAGTGGPKKEASYKVYVLKDGTELKAYMAVKMGEQITIKDEQGEMRTLNASDVKEVRNGP